MVESGEGQIIAEAQEAVVLLHGLARTAWSMKKFEVALKREGYHVINISYPSRKAPLETLGDSVWRDIQDRTASFPKVHFVTHSMGGILVRYCQSKKPIIRLGRVVMLSPPNQGSEIVDRIGKTKLFKWFNGPAGQQLGTQEGSILESLPDVDFELGVITGDRSINWILSLMITGKNDGKVSVARAKVEGMCDFRVVHVAHPFIMKNNKVIHLAKTFLKHGYF